MKKILFVALAVSGFSVWAGTSAPAVPAASTALETRHTLNDARGKTMRFTLRHSVNEHGEREVAVDFEETRSLLPDTQVTLLYGRDLDSDGHYDAWFIIRSSGGIDVREGKAERRDGWDAVSKLLTDEVSIHKRSGARVLFTAAATHLTMTGAAQQNSIEKITRKQMDLYDLELRNQRLRAMNPLDPLLIPQGQLIAQGWSQLAEEIQDSQVRDQLLWAAADVASIFVGGLLLKAIAVPARWAAPKVAESGFGEVANGLYDAYLRDIAESSAMAIGRAKHALSSSTSHIGSALLAAKLTVTERITLQIRGLEARGKVGQLLAKHLRRVGASMRETGKELKYIGVSTSLQRGAQMYLDKGTAEADPLVVAREIGTNEELLTNAGFVAIEKLVMARARARGANRGEQVALLGVLVTGKATAMNYFGRNEMDPGRIALDAGFDAIVGNLDMAAMDYFERLAAAKGNPRLRFAGYAVVVVDNVVGSAVYHWATEKYEESRKNKPKPAPNSTSPGSSQPEVQLVPMFVAA